MVASEETLRPFTPRIHLVYARYQRYAVRFKQNKRKKTYSYCHGDKLNEAIP